MIISHEAKQRCTSFKTMPSVRSGLASAQVSDEKAISSPAVNSSLIMKIPPSSKGDNSQ